MQTIPDSPQREDRLDWRTDMYLHRGHTLEAWGNLDPELNFHRPLRDYWQALVEPGFTVDARGAKHSRQDRDVMLPGLWESQLSIARTTTLKRRIEHVARSSLNSTTNALFHRAQLSSSRAPTEGTAPSPLRYACPSGSPPSE